MSGLLDGIFSLAGTFLAWLVHLCSAVGLPTNPIDPAQVMSFAWSLDSFNEYLPLQELYTVTALYLSLWVGVAVVRVGLFVIHQFWGSN